MILLLQECVGRIASPGVVTRSGDAGQFTRTYCEDIFSQTN